MDAHGNLSHFTLGEKRVNVVEMVVIALLLSASTSTLLWDFGLVGLTRGLAGLAALALAIARRNLPSPIRIGLVGYGILLAVSGWLDFEGWRFLERQPPAGSP